MAALGAAARRPLTEAVAVERRGLGLTTDAGEALARALADLERYAEELARLTEDEAGNELDREEDRHRERFAAAVSAAIGLALAQLLSRSDVAAILDLRKLEIGRGIRAMLTDLRNRIAGAAIARATSSAPGGADAFEAAIVEAIEAARKRGSRIARIEIAKLNGQLNEYRQRQIGVKSYRWRTILDGRERPEHHNRNRKIFEWDAPPTGGHPGTEINCRCRAIAVLEPED